MPFNLQISDSIAITGILVTLILAFLNYWVKKRNIQNKLFKCKWVRACNMKPKYLLDSTRPYNKYYPRDIDDEIRELIIQQKSILVTGQPLAGKTRTIFEVLKNIDETFEVIIPRPMDIDYEDYPFPRNITIIPKIIILDDFDIFVNIGNFERLKAIIEEKNLIVVATCQSGDKYAVLKTKFPVSAFFEDNIIEIGTIQKDEAKKIAEKENIEWEKTEFDGTIGSIFVDIHEKRRRYRELPNTEKDILKTIKKLQISGIYEGNHIFLYEWIETVFNAIYPDIKLNWENILDQLTLHELVSVPDEKKIHVEEVYLEKIVEFSNPQTELTILNEMLNIFSGRIDVLSKIGYKALSFESIRENKTDFARITIRAFEEALKVYTFDDFPMKYAGIQNNLAIAYIDLAEVEDKKKNISKAIKSCKEALKVCTFDEVPVSYALILNILGHAYCDLAEAEDMKNNLYKAKIACEDALNICAYYDVSTEYAMIQNNLGIIYSQLAEVEDKKNNLCKSIKAREEALKTFTFNEFPREYATIHYNLGSAYRDMAGMENGKSKLNRSIKSYQEALKVCTLAEFPLKYAMIQNNLGVVYGNMAEVEDKKENISKAIKAYEEALKVYTFTRFPREYAMIQNNLGIVYGNMAEIEYKKENISKVIKAYEEALKVYTIDELPEEYAGAQINLGAAYGLLAEVENKKNNINRAIKAFEEALKVCTLNGFQIHYAGTLNNLGIAYMNLAEVEDKKKNISKAIKAYEEALKVFEHEKMEEYTEPLKKNISILQSQLQND